VRVFILKSRLLGLVSLVLILFGFGIWGYGYFGVKKTVPTLSPSQMPVYQGNSSLQMIAFTFNVDWGEAYLPDLLSILEQNWIKATFFVTGRFASQFPALTAQIATAGHEVGNHGYLHLHVDTVSDVQHREDLVKAEEALQKITGQKTVLYAPPYGEHADHVVLTAAELGYRTILWTIDTIDWQPGRQPETIVSKVVDNAKNGAIILMHPTKPTVQALPEMIRQLQEKKYSFGKVSEVIL